MIIFFIYIYKFNFNRLNNYIVHCADIHIRNTSRYDEYQSQFKKFIKKVDLIKPKYVVIAGDLFHSQLILSPESYFLAKNFIRSILEICKVIIVPGNHDLNLNNIKRMDGISSFIDEFDKESIFYLKDSGNYDFDGQITFSSFSIADKKNYPTLPKNDKKKIALYHGTISGSENHFGFKFLSNETISIFNGWDAALLGDIHKMQYLDGKKRIAYSGSLIQQDFGESQSKGFLVWDLDTLQSEFVELENDYSFIKINGSNDLENLKLSKYSHLVYVDDRKRIHSEISEIKKSIYDLALKQSSEILSYRYEYEDNDELINVDEEIENIYDLNVQKQLLDEFLTSKKHSKDIIEKCKDLHEKVFNNVITNENQVRNWQIENFKFSNLFAYGENNEFDFSKLKGVTGIFGHNASGKSSILSAIKYAIWGESINKISNEKIINFKADNAKSHITLRNNGVRYEIFREIQKSKIGKISTNVSIKIGSEKLEGKEDVKKMINDIFGTASDFSDTAFCTQFEIHKLIYTKPAERKQLLIDFLGLDIFNKFLEDIKKKHNELEYKIKSFSKNKIIEEYKNTLEKVETQSSEAKVLKNNITNLEIEINQISETIVNLSTQIKEVKELRDHKEILLSIENAKKKNDEIIKLFEVEKLKTENDLENEIKLTEQYKILDVVFVEKTEDELKNEVKNKQEYINVKNDIDSFVINKEYEIDLSEKTKQLENLNSSIIDVSHLKIELNNLYNQFNNIDEKIEESKRKIKIIDEKEWYRSNEYCKQCSFLSDAFVQEKKLKEFEIEKTKFQTELQNKVNEIEDSNNKNKEFNELILALKEEIEAIKLYQKNKIAYENALNKIALLEQIVLNEYNLLKKSHELNIAKIEELIKAHKLEHSNKIKIFEYELEKSKNELKLFEDELDFHNKNIEVIKNNQNLENDIASQKNALDLKKTELKNEHDLLNNITAELLTLQTTLKNIDKQLEDIKIVENEFEVYNAYYSAVQRDGLPKSIIVKYIDIITNKINEILKDIVDWKVKLRSDDKNIEIIIEESNGFESNADETGSGMQVTLIGLTLRVILNVISKKSKSKFLFIDEPFAALDYEIKSKIESYFNHLKQIFSHIILISHLEIQDICDNIIITEKIDGQSKLIVN